MAAEIHRDHIPPLGKRPAEPLECGRVLALEEAWTDRHGTTALARGVAVIRDAHAIRAAHRPALPRDQIAHAGSRLGLAVRVRNAASGQTIRPANATCA